MGFVIPWIEICDGDCVFSCLVGFTGRNCEININECDLQLCENRATCRDHVNGFECICTENFVGEYCNLFGKPFFLTVPQELFAIKFGCPISRESPDMN